MSKYLPKIIAEIGVSHGGSVELAKRLIKIAAGCGCWGVKFQHYKPELLERPTTYRSIGGFPRKTNALHTLKKWQFTVEQLAETRKFAKENHIKWGASVFDVPSVKELVELRPDFAKLPCGAPAEVEQAVCDEPGLYRALKFMSYTPGSIPSAAGCAGIRLMCVPRYPCRVEDYFPQNEMPDGVSDHTADRHSAAMWRALKLEWVEAHIAMNSTDPDANVSLLPLDLMAYVKILNEPIEKPATPKQRYWAALRKLKRGEKIVPWVDAAPLRDVSAKVLRLKCPEYAYRNCKKGDAL